MSWSMKRLWNLYYDYVENLPLWAKVALVVVSLFVLVQVVRWVL